MQKQKVLILGVTGMLGHTLFKEMSKKQDNYNIYGTTRNANGLSDYFTEQEIQSIRSGVDADNFDTIIRAIASVQPNIIINCKTHPNMQQLHQLIIKSNLDSHHLTTLLILKK